MKSRITEYILICNRLQIETLHQARQPQINKLNVNGMVSIFFVQNNTHLAVIITSYYQQRLSITCNYMLYFFLLAFVCSLSIKWFNRSSWDEMAQTSHHTYQRYIYHGNSTNLKVSLLHRIHYDNVEAFPWGPCSLVPWEQLVNSLTLDIVP